MTKKQILLVEDDASLRDALCDTLNLNGYDVIQAADGQQAGNKLKKGFYGCGRLKYQAKGPRLLWLGCARYSRGPYPDHRC